MTARSKACGLFIFLLSAWSLVAVQPQQEVFQSLSSSIRDEFSNLKTLIDSMQSDLESTTNLLTTRSADLKLSEEEREALKTQRNDLSTSLENMIEQFNNLSQKCIKLEAGIQIRNKLIAGLIAAVIAFGGWVIFLLKVKLC